MIKRGQLADFEATSFRPGDLRLEAFHPMSTARMGADPATSVTDPDGAVRGAEGLYVADGSLLPELGRRQPDDDHHRLRDAGRRGVRVASVRLDDLFAHLEEGADRDPADTAAMATKRPIFGSAPSGRSSST